MVSVIIDGGRLREVMWATDWTFITSVLAQTYASPTLQQSRAGLCNLHGVHCNNLLLAGEATHVGVIASAAAQVQYIHGSLPAWPGTCGRSLHCLCIVSLAMLRESWLSAHATIVM